MGRGGGMRGARGAIGDAVFESFEGEWVPTSLNIITLAPQVSPSPPSPIFPITRTRK